MIISAIMLDPPAYRRVKCVTRNPPLHSRFDMTARGSLGMQIGSAAIRSKRGMALKFILRSLNIYQAHLINVTFGNRRESGLTAEQKELRGESLT